MFKSAAILPAALLSAALLSPTALAQVKPGHYIVVDQLTVGTVKTGQMWTVDPSTRTATPLKWNSTIIPNAVKMLSPVVGYIATNSPADVYRITITGTTVKETKLNTSAITGTNIAQLVLFGGTWYFTTNGGAAGKNALWSMPLGGGKPTLVWDDSKLKPALPTGQLANALAGDPKTGKIYICYWTSGIVVEYDTKTKASKQLITLKGKVNAAILPVNAQIDASGNLVVASLYGDIVFVDVKKATIIKNLEPRTASSAAPWSPYKNSVVYNPDTGDWVFGSRDGSVEPVGTIGPRQIARRMTVVIKPPYTTTKNNPNGISCGGIDYISSGGSTSSYMAYAAGCSNTAAGNFFPSSGAGVIAKASKSFSFTLDGMPANSIGVLAIGVNKINASIGGGCALFTTPILLLPAVATPSDPAKKDNGTYRAQIGPLALPAGNQQLNTQWAVAWASGSTINLLTSDARTLSIK